jgi:hypothetical protein
MILFGESLNVFSNVIGKQFKEADPAKRDPVPIQEECVSQKELGMDYIDINLGPAKKFGTELMPLKQDLKFVNLLINPILSILLWPYLQDMKKWYPLQ